MVPASQPSAQNKSDEGNRSDSGSAQPSWRREFLWFAVGVWVFIACFLLLGSAAEDTFRRWSGQPGLLVGLGLMAPFMAIVLATAFTGWLSYRVREAGRTKPEMLLFPLAAGFFSVPACLVVLRFLPTSPENVYDLLGMVIFLGMPFGLAEFCFRISRTPTAEAGKPKRPAASS